MSKIVGEIRNLKSEIPRVENLMIGLRLSSISHIIVENLMIGLRLSSISHITVENNGFEPLTPCLQSRCSSQLS